jgi:hypothetical protein
MVKVVGGTTMKLVFFTFIDLIELTKKTKATLNEKQLDLYSFIGSFLYAQWEA